MKEKTILVETPAPLLSFLLFHLKDLSRNSVKHLLQRGQVLVDGTPTRQFDFLLSPGQHITILPPSRGPALPFPVIYEDAGLIVVSKPAGLLSTATETQQERTAYRMVLEYLRNRDPKSRLFLVHRLDRDTSGVLIFAKDNALRQTLQTQWNSLVKVRRYWAVVEGTSLPDSGTFRSYLTENRNHKVYSTHHSQGKEAVTQYWVLDRKNGLSLLSVEIHTGRKNQIRVHLSESGHPVVGDEKYGASSDPFGRLGLHACLLEMIDPRNQARLTFFSPAPEEFRRIFPSLSQSF